MNYTAENNLHRCEYNYNMNCPYWFSEDMRDNPLFAKCESNYEVSALLRAAGVFAPEDSEDSEYSAMCVNFKTEEHGVAFISRLNRYIEKRRKRRAEHRF